MKLINKTRNVVLHEHPALANTYLRRTIGLMFRAPKHECVVFQFAQERQEILHMWFVFAPIDVLVLDKAGKVISLKENLRPWRMWDIETPGIFIIELPVGAIHASGTKAGDQIVLPDHFASIWRWYHYLLFFMFAAGVALVFAWLFSRVLFFMFR